MALQTLIAKLEDVHESIREHYTPVDPEDPDSGFTLATDKSQEKGTVREFRQTHKTLSERAELAESKLKAFNGADPESLARAMSALKQVEDSEEQAMILDGKYEDVIARRTEGMKLNFDSQLEAQTRAYGELEAKYSELYQEQNRRQVGDLVTAAITQAKIKVRPGAMPFILQKTQDRFELDKSGNPVVKSGVKWGKNGEALTMGEHIESLVETTPFLFEGSGGADSSGSTTGGQLRTIDGSDSNAFSKAGTIEDVAAGRTVVAMPNA